ncbi:MAG: hypothetical protein M1828_001313 [Chrysothrix sp. TS-e1954]|nr:MAG: hypothetical protein M1828_001313 [Chrysothrix sp. TS-e1954]
MPAYFFHLAFELYTSLQESEQHDHPTDKPFIPPQNLNIFDQPLPKSSWASSLAPLEKRPISHKKLEQRRSLALRPRASGHRTQTREHGSHPSHATDDITQQPAEAVKRNSNSQDWRLDSIVVESIDMESQAVVDNAKQDEARQVLGTELALKGEYTATKPQSSDFGCGVVHLYRNSQPSSRLSDESTTSDDDASEINIDDQQAFVDKECTTLCILAVPSYMTPSDLLGWMGQDTRDIVSHFRLLRTSRSNRYMVLMKFREPKSAKHWQKTWNGKLFNSMEPENCHVVFIRSIQFQTREANKDPSSFPSMTNDPFIPATAKKNLPQATPSSTALTTKPAPPPTPSLIELPTCPVCLERMDETTGLATIFCQHVFHCACLQKWRGSGCPVCRYTQDDILSKSLRGADTDHTHECSTCSADVNLWICLICGNIGCGRYDSAHAFAHYKQTSHSFAMDTSTQHIWDYAGDEYVHRLIQNESDGKLVELPASGALADDDHTTAADVVPRNKMEDMSLEYTYLLTSQLDSQRIYFEDQISRAASKATSASATASTASTAATTAQSRLDALQATHTSLIAETIPSLQRENSRLETRASRFETTARKMEKEWREKEVINESLMDRIRHLEIQVDDATCKCSELEEQNRDLSFFISGTERLKGAGEEVVEGSVGVVEKPEAQGGGKKKRKGKR